MSRLNPLLKVAVVGAGLIAVGVVVITPLALADITVGTNVMVTDADGPDGLPESPDDDPKMQAEVAIAVNPITGERLAAWMDQHDRPDELDFRDKTIGFGLFDELTGQWSHDAIWENPAITTPSNFAWSGRQYDPGAAIGGNRTRYMVANHAATLAPETIILIRQRLGEGWKLQTFASVVDRADKVLVTADPTPPALDPDRAKRLFIHWSSDGVGYTTAVLMKFLDGGDSLYPPSGPPVFPPQEEVANATDPDPLGPATQKRGPASDVGPYGEVHLAWWDLRQTGPPPNPFDDEIRYRKLLPDMTTWDPALTPDYTSSRPVTGVHAFGAGDNPNTNHQVNNIPTIAVDWGQHPDECRRRRGWVYIAYSSDEGGNADIYCVRSRNNGQTWDPPVRVNDDPTNTQIFPFVDVDHMGRVIFMWLDKRDDTTAPVNQAYHVYMSVSYDGGFSFEPNVPVTTEPSDPGQFGLTWIGDYNYMTVAPDPDDPTGNASLAYPIWCDQRNDELPNTNNKNIGDIYSAPVQITGDPYALPDFDNDTDVDLEDFLTLQLCFSGSGNPPPPGCERADFDGDDDVDLDDFLLLQRCFTGSASESGASGLSPEDVTEMAGWCYEYLGLAQREDFADVLRDAAARRPDASDARLALALAQAIDPEN